MDIRAETVADAFFSGWIARFGTPATITTDRGAQFESKLWDGLCNQFGIVRNRPTSYHVPPVERHGRTFPPSVKSSHYGTQVTESMDNNTTLRFAVKELLGRSAAEMIYGTTLRLPGEFTQKYTIDAHTNLDR